MPNRRRDSRSRRLRLSQACADFATYCEPLHAKRTTQAYVRTARFFIHFTGDMSTLALRPEHVDRYLAHLRQPHLDPHGLERAPLSDTAYFVHARHLRPFMKWLHMRRHTDWDLAGGIRCKRPTSRVRLRLTPAQVATMLQDARRPRDRALMAIAYFTATRGSELKTMRIGDVNLDAGTIFIHVWKSRTEDELAIGPELREELVTWLRIYQQSTQELLGRSLLPHDFLIPARTPTRIIGNELIDGKRHVLCRTGLPDPTRPMPDPHLVVADALDRLGVERHNEAIHVLRRSAARHIFDALVEDGAYDGALRIVQSLLHHSSMADTEHYIGLGTERYKRDEFLRTAYLLSDPAKNAITALPAG